jgi:hypothetical protein
MLLGRWRSEAPAGRHEQGPAWPGGSAHDRGPGTDQQPPKPDQQPPRDDIRWLIYLAIGFVVVLALLLLSGMQSSHMGH